METKHKRENKENKRDKREDKRENSRKHYYQPLKMTGCRNDSMIYAALLLNLLFSVAVFILMIPVVTLVYNFYKGENIHTLQEENFHWNLNFAVLLNANYF